MGVKASLIIKPDSLKLRRKLSKLGRRITDLQKPHEETGQDMTKETQKNLQSRINFEGQRIAPLKQSTIERRERRGTGGDHPLVETGAMRDSVAYKVTARKHVSKTVIGPRGRGRQQKKARFHWHGGRRRPKRQFMGLNRKNIKDIKDNFQKYIKTEIRIVTR